MSGLCGWVGEADPRTLDLMLAAIPHRGDSRDTVHLPGMSMGYRWHQRLPGHAQGIYHDGREVSAVAGVITPAVASPAAELRRLLSSGRDTLDGAFVGASWDVTERRLTLACDPFGVRSVYYTEHKKVLYFATELKQLLAIPGLPRVLDESVIHRYLTFSFVPGEETPIRGIRRLLPRRIAEVSTGRPVSVSQYFELREELDPAMVDRRTAVRRTEALCRTAVAERAFSGDHVGLFLSGGLDSSSVALWLADTGVSVQAISLDFGVPSSELEHAETVAHQLRFPLHRLRVGAGDIAAVMADLVWVLDLPFGDAVTGPQYLLARAAQQHGCTCVFNGEGGDQLFGGWTQKPMLGAELYAGLFGADTREERYLGSYHRFYGLEEALYTPDFRDRSGPAGQRRALLTPYLQGAKADTFAGHIRLADFALKGCQNILPRIERAVGAHGLDVRVPLFDRALAQAAFALPPQLKLHGAVEKYVLKLAVRGRLPRNVVWRRKRGMGVPITEWVLGGLAPAMQALVGRESLARRGLFQSSLVEQLLAGRNLPRETSRRRIGERLWALAMLEAWMRVFIDNGGRRPGGSWN